MLTRSIYPCGLLPPGLAPTLGSRASCYRSSEGGNFTTPTPRPPSPRTAHRNAPRPRASQSANPGARTSPSSPTLGVAATFLLRLRSAAS
ncbi:hypothetical protein Micbo1qcDRAFT_167927 [Microdochium bolleyi]|uniref:Uncharacterized protein n=1 Tax=Microdochium bolleyi TaxID=196109 RepID=A0A136IPK5_9PEZI|nr:hypothetical protein Micbo1qcDRAFT_167927 [Microdochium bolleyi]